MKLNKYQERIVEEGKKKQARLVLPEVNDPRVSLAKRQLRDFGYEIIDFESFGDKTEQYRESLAEERFFIKMSEEAQNEYLQNPLNIGMLMVRNGDADGLVAGAVTSTSDVLRAAIRIVGIKPESRWASSSFFLISPEENSALTYSDCGVIPEPTSDQLASIAAEAAEFHQLLSGEEPRVAFLSFSTKGSAQHRRVAHVQKAVEIFAENHPDILHDGELQVDSALVPAVAAKKTKNSPLNGNANVLIFPNLEAGNIAYKITERLAGYTAWGPLLQGLKKPVHDLSRGCSSADIVNVATIAALQKVT